MEVLYFIFPMHLLFPEQPIQEFYLKEFIKDILSNLIYVDYQQVYQLK